MFEYGSCRLVTIRFNPKDLSNLYSNRRKSVFLLLNFTLVVFAGRNLAPELKKSFFKGILGYDRVNHMLITT